MSKQQSSRENLLNIAEQLFTSRGYTAVTLKDIAKALGIKQASLYYHFPLGKEDLYVEVMLRHLERRSGVLKKLIAQANPDLENCLLSVGMWLIEQPPLNGGRMILTDLPQLSQQKAEVLESAMYRCAFAPIEELFARYRDDLQDSLQQDPGFIGGAFISAIESLYTFKRYGVKDDEELVADLITLLLKGAVKR
ncbi:MAG: TetR/AcrR family transcriptional regulator [Rivularia sp. (in: cyanobacteria)]